MAGIRVTQVCKLVLASPPSPLSPSASDVFGLTDTPSVHVIYARSVADSFSLTQSALPRQPIAVTAADTFTLTDAPAVVYVHCVHDTFSLADAATCVHCCALSATDTLGLVDQGSYQKIYQCGAADSLSWVHTTLVTYPHHLTVADTWSQAIYALDPTTGLLVVAGWRGLQDAVQLNTERANPSANTDSLALNDYATVVVLRASGISVSASDSLGLTDYAARNPPGTSASDQWTWTDTAAAARQRAPVGDPLGFVDTASCTVIRNLSVSDTLYLEESFVSFAATHLALWQYTPFVGPGSTNSPTPPPVTLSGPVAGIGPCRFVYPVNLPASPTSSVELRSPEFGNKDRLQFNRISRETRGGTLIVFADPIWPKIETQVLTFTGLSQTQAFALQTFISTYLGLEVGFVDWEQRYWQGVITNTTEPVVQDGRGCMFTASLEFECQLTPWPVVS